MNNFTFNWVTKIIFGKGTESTVGKEIKPYSSKVLFHYGGGSIKKSGLYDRVIKSLNENGIEYVELSGVQPNPRLSLVREGIEICRKNNIDFVLAVGGGSVIDSAKAIAVGTIYDGDVWDFYTEKVPVTKTLPTGVILTIPATGSEASKSSVITNEDGWYKRPINIDVVKPKFAIMNPELTYTLPPYQTACGAADIMAHVMERYFTNTRGVDLTDRLCEATLKTIIENTPIVLKNPEDYEARAQIMWAGTVAHNDLLSTGRVGDFASHKIEHEISGIYDVAHGAGLAAIFPAWMKYVYRHDINRFVQFASRVWNIDICFENLEKTALEGIQKLTDFFKSIGLPVTLEEMDVPDDRLEEMAEKCVEAGPVGAFVPIYKEDALNILKLAK